MCGTNSERASSADPVGLRHHNASIALFAAGFATFSIIYCVQPLMPTFSDYFDVTAVVSSLSLSLTTGVLAFIILLTGLLSEAIPRKSVIGLCLVAASLLSLLAAAAPSWAWLLAARALTGVVLGSVPPLALAYLAEETPVTQLGSATGLYIGGNAIGGMTGRVAAGVLADIGGWQLVFVVEGVMGFLAAAVFWRLLPQSRNFRLSRGLSLADHVAPMAAHLRHGALFWVFVSAFALMGAFVTVYNYLPYRLAAPPFQLGSSAIGAIFVVYLLGAASSAAAGRLNDRYGRPLILAAGLTVMMFGFLAIMSASLGIIIVGTALVTAGFFAAHATAGGWTGQLASHGKGQAAGLYLLAYYLGSSVVGSVGGVFWAYAGWEGVLVLVGIMMLLAWVALFRLRLWQSRHQTS